MSATTPSIPSARALERALQRPHQLGHHGQHQAGVAMLVVLVFTLALTGLAVFSAKFAFLGEAVARNQLDQQVARQAAEAALRDAERDLLMLDGSKKTGAKCERVGERPVMSHLSLFDDACTRGQCGYRPETVTQADYGVDTSNAGFKAGEAWWPPSKGGKWGEPNVDNDCKDLDGGVPLGTFTGASPIAAVARQPEYMVEIFRRGEGHAFRITARGFGYRDTTQTVLQTYFLVPSDY